MVFMYYNNCMMECVHAYACMYIVFSVKAVMPVFSVTSAYACMYIVFSVKAVMPVFSVTSACADSVYQALFSGLGTRLTV